MKISKQLKKGGFCGAEIFENFEKIEKRGFESFENFEKIGKKRGGVRGAVNLENFEKNWKKGGFRGAEILGNFEKLGEHKIGVLAHRTTWPGKGLGIPPL